MELWAVLKLPLSRKQKRLEAGGDPCANPGLDLMCKYYDVPFSGKILEEGSFCTSEGEMSITKRFLSRPLNMFLFRTLPYRGVVPIRHWSVAEVCVRLV